MPCPRSDGPPCDSDEVRGNVDERLVEAVLARECCPVCGGKAVLLRVDGDEAVLECSVMPHGTAAESIICADMLHIEPSQFLCDHADETPWRVPLRAQRDAWDERSK